jgi:hypothetical protein
MMISLEMLNDNTMNDLNDKLKKLKNIRLQSGRKYNSEVWSLGHDLAEAGYIPAAAYFLEGLNDPSWSWRQDCIRFLGFHYKLDQGVLNKIGDLALADPSSHVRMTAVTVLGNYSSLPEKTLTKVLVSDKSNSVRKVAFKAVLKMFGVSKEVITRELKMLKTQDKQPTLEIIEEILEKEGIQDYYDYFSFR